MRLFEAKRGIHAPGWQAIIKHIILNCDSGRQPLFRYFDIDFFIVMLAKYWRWSIATLRPYQILHYLMVDTQNISRLCDTHLMKWNAPCAPLLRQNIIIYCRHASTISIIFMRHFRACTDIKIMYILPFLASEMCGRYLPSGDALTHAGGEPVIAYEKVARTDTMIYTRSPPGT